MSMIPFEHGGQDHSGKDHGCFEIQSHDVANGLGVDGVEVGSGVQTGVVDEDIDWTSLVFNSPDQIVDLIRVEEVGGEGEAVEVVGHVLDDIA